MAEQILTLKEVADYLKLTEKTAYRLAAEGKPGFKVGGSLRFKHSDIDAWIEESKAGKKIGTQIMVLDNKNSGYVGTELKAQAYESSKLSVLSALFTLYGFSFLKKEISKLSGVRLLLTA